MIQFKLVFGLFGQSNMISTLDFCPRQAKKKRKVPLHKPPLTAAAFRFIRLTNAQYVHPGNVIGLKFGKPVLTSAPEKQANLLFCKKG